MSNFKNGEALIDDLIAASKAKNVDNEKDKDALRNYVRKATIPQTKKDVYLKQLNTPYVNVTPIKGLVNANVEAQKVDAETKLKTLTNLTTDERAKFKNRLQIEPTEGVLKEAEKLNSNRKTVRKNKNKTTKNVAKALQGLTTLTRENRKSFMNKLPQNGQEKVISNAVALNIQRKKNMANEERKKKLGENTKVFDTKLRSLRNLTDEERAKYMNNFKMAPSTADVIMKRAIERNARVRGLRTGKEQNMKNLSTQLQKFTNLTKNNRRKYIERLKTEDKRNILREANAENVRRKTEKQKVLNDEIAKRKAQEAAKKNRNLQIKTVATKLQGLTSLERENRKKFMNRLATNGANKVVSNAKALNAERKAEQAAQKKKEEMERQMIEDKKKAEEAAKKNRNLQIKRVATKLQGLTSLERENRKKFMNRLATNGDQKVLANAVALNKERKKIREGVEWKLKQIGAKGSNLQAFMKRWNNSKNKTIFNNARKKVINKQPLLNKVVREIPGTFGQWRRGWEDAIRKAETPQELERLDRLLDEKSRLRTEIEKAPIAEDKRKGQLRFVMQLRNDIGKRRIELARDIKTKKDMGDAATKQTAQKLQSMDKLSRNNRKRFMNRVAGGEDTRTVLTNADKLQRNRVAAERVKQQKAEQDKKALENKRRREEEEKKRKDQEKAKQNKLKANTAKMFQSMNGLERKNRKEFMQRLERGNDPAKVIANARARDRFTFNKKPSGQLKTMTAAQRFGEPSSSDAKNQIYGMRGMGVKNQQSFIKRLERGEDASRVLRDARAREQMIRSRVSTTKRQLQYNTKVRSVVRRL